MIISADIYVTFQPPLIVRGGGFGGLRRSRKGYTPILSLSPPPQAVPLPLIHSRGGLKNFCWILNLNMKFMSRFSLP